VTWLRPACDQDETDTGVLSQRGHNFSRGAREMQDQPVTNRSQLFRFVHRRSASRRCERSSRQVLEKPTDFTVVHRAFLEPARSFAVRYIISDRNVRNVASVRIHPCTNW